MKIYCMCGHNQFIEVPTIPNTNVERDTIKLANGLENVVSLCIPMKIEKIGVAQIILSDTNNAIRRHYPNVDIRVCENCGNTIAIE